MIKNSKSAIAPKREENFPDWYQNVVKSADLAENSGVRGSMIIKPNGFSIWEMIQNILNGYLKQSGHKNAYFPLLIPLSYLEKEAEHVDGFAKECAVVTHSKLTAENGNLIPDGKLEEPLVIRPTSETIIGESMAKWIKSYRDLPLKLNQWANVMRWEMRTRMFLRTSEFLWQEGHTAHADEIGAREEVELIIEFYRKLIEDHLAIPALIGPKTPDEKFPGAVETFTLETLMQDNKAVQAGTSHYLGTNFAKSSGIKYLSSSTTEEYAHTTSWGVSTRLIGALIMSHSDDNGLVLPPKIAETHVVIIPVTPKESSKEEVVNYCNHLCEVINNEGFKVGTAVLRSYVDQRDLRWGEKKWDNIKKGAPIIIQIGPKDIGTDSLQIIKRNDIDNTQKIQKQDIAAALHTILCEMQSELFETAKVRVNENTKNVDDLEKFRQFFAGGGGFAIAPWCEDAIDHEILKEHKVTPRCIVNNSIGNNKCIFTGKQASALVAFAKAY